MVLLETFTTGLVFARHLTQEQQPYVLIEITHCLKYLDQFLTVLLETFPIGLVFARRSKQGAATLCLDRNYTLP